MPESSNSAKIDGGRKRDDELYSPADEAAKIWSEKTAGEMHACKSEDGHAQTGTLKTEDGEANTEDGQETEVSAERQ